jgi:motility quorum-sensing regulator/GCU-specific mRNA interferase toxin
MLLDQGRVCTTRTAGRNAAALGLHVRDMVSIVRGLSAGDFYKSMTTYDDHRVWQDVYRPWTAIGRVYLKLMVVDEVLIVSFKEL